MKKITVKYRLIALLAVLTLATSQVACSDDAPLDETGTPSTEADAAQSDADPGEADTPAPSNPDAASPADANPPEDTHQEADDTEDPGAPDIPIMEPDIAEEPDVAEQPDTTEAPDTTGEAEVNCSTPIVEELLALVNASRATEGAGPLSCDAGLTRAAQLHAEDMCAQNYFSHDSLDGRTFDQRIRAQGVSGGAMAENIAAGSATPEQVHPRWMDSPGHRRNIMNPVYQRLGVGFIACSTATYPYYWVETFAD